MKPMFIVKFLVLNLVAISDINAGFHNVIQVLLYGYTQLIYNLFHDRPILDNSVMGTMAVQILLHIKKIKLPPPFLALDLLREDMLVTIFRWKQYLNLMLTLNHLIFQVVFVLRIKQKIYYELFFQRTTTLPGRTAITALDQLKVSVV